MSFFSGFFGIIAENGEQQVCCPFPHKTPTAQLEYFETRPSAHVNTLKHLFHCKACGRGYNEEQFIENILGCSNVDAVKVLKCFEAGEDNICWLQNRHLSDAGKQLAKQLGIQEEVATQLQLATPTGAEGSLMFPVVAYDTVIDIRTYTPGGDPKVKSKPNATNGLIIPYDIWRRSHTTRVTIVCAGEKDMAVARSHGLNAITLTGGEQAIPKFLNCFKDRMVAICYDHDETGIAGAKKLAAALLPFARGVKIVTGFHDTCKEPKEDITDFFVKYHKRREDLIKYIEATPLFTPEEAAEQHVDKEKDVPITDLFTATQPQHINKLMRSNIQVVAVTDTTFTMPVSVMFEKFAEHDGDALHTGACISWALEAQHLGDALHLMDNNFSTDDIKKNLRAIVKIPAKEKGVHIRTLASETVFKAYVTDMFETNVENAVPMEFQAYSIGTRLESGRKYLVTYKLVPHPYKGQQLTMIITDAKQADDSVSNFKVTPEIIQQLKVFQAIPGTTTERINILTAKVKGLLGYNGNDTLIQAIDLAYHTALQFNFGSFKDIRGYLDTLIVGESRVGKSSTADTLRQHYGLGVFTSLAGNSATIPGLIGGSNKTTTGFQTRAGVIPQNHRGLVIFEEFGKCKQDVVSELTDIRSSNEVRIARVSGALVLPALVRMISLTNVKNTNGGIKSIAAYPNGIAIITELVGTAEDIARYDLLVVLSDRGNSQIDPFWQPEQPLSDAAYQARVRWIWSRTTEQIKIEKEVGLYIMERANELNKDFNCHIKIFGTEAWKKLSRLSIAIAGYLVSSDETYENIVVQKEHVDYAEAFFRRIYDNETFKLKEYVQNERAYSTIDAEGVVYLQDIYTKFPALLLQLERQAGATRNTLASAAGLTQDDLSKALSQLTKGLFIQYAGYDIMPTERFRLGMRQINKATVIRKVGEPDA